MRLDRRSLEECGWVKSAAKKRAGAKMTLNITSIEERLRHVVALPG
jgi:hypothetical protein